PVFSTPETDTGTRPPMRFHGLSTAPFRFCLATVSRSTVAVADTLPLPMMVTCGSVIPCGSSDCARYANHELTSSSETDVRRTDAARVVAIVDCAEIMASLRENESACCGVTLFAATTTAAPNPRAMDARPITALRATIRLSIRVLLSAPARRRCDHGAG